MQNVLAVLALEWPDASVYNKQEAGKYTVNTKHSVEVYLQASCEIVVHEG